MMMLRKLNTAPDLFEAIATDVFSAIGEFGQIVVDDLKDRISVPVEYVQGPRGGTIIIRSQPGEPPRMETQALHDSIEKSVEADADVFSVEISSDIFYAPILEEKLTRYAWVPVTEDHAEEFIDRMVTAVQGK